MINRGSGLGCGGGREDILDKFKVKYHVVGWQIDTGTILDISMRRPKAGLGGLR